MRTELTEDPFVAIVPRGHPLADAGTIALADLRGETWVSNDYPRSYGHRLVVAACSAAGFRPRFSVQAQDHYTAIGFVAAGIGVSVLPGLAARSLPATVVRLGIAAPTPVRHLAAVVHDLGAPNPPAERAVALLKELIAHPSGVERAGRSPLIARSGARRRVRPDAVLARREPPDAGSAESTSVGRGQARVLLALRLAVRLRCRTRLAAAWMPWARRPANRTPGARRA